MHETLVFGSCSECSKFVSVFPMESAFGDWGYCSDQNEPPPADEIAALFAAATSGNRAALRENLLGLYRLESDDGCDFFHERDDD